MKNRRKPRKERGKKGNYFALNVRTGDETSRVRRVRRIRLLHWIFKGSVLASGLFMVLVLLRHGYERIFIENEHFTLTRLEITTNGRMERSKVLAVTALREGNNLLKVDLAMVQEAVEALPQVESVEVRRILPDTLKIRLEERVPVAWIASSREGWRPRSALYGLLVGADARLFRCTQLSPDLLGLPVLSLPTGDDLRPGGQLASRTALAGLHVLSHASLRIDDPRAAPLVRASVHNAYTIEVETEDGISAWLGLEDPLGDYEKLSRIREEFANTTRRVVFANVLPRRNIAVRFASPGESTAPIPRARLVQPPPSPTPRSSDDSARNVRAILNRR